MSKHRLVETCYWDDTYVMSLDPSEKLIFIYLLTNPLTCICGVYEIAIKRIAFDTGFDKEVVERVLTRFERDGKCLYRNGWIAMRNWLKHQAAAPGVQEGIRQQLLSVPKEMAEYVRGGVTPVEPTSYPILSDPIETRSDRDSIETEAGKLPAVWDADSPVGILAYLNAKTGKSYRSTTAANLAGIRARLKDGFTAGDCRKVIDVKHAEWWNAAETRKYVNPVTLFRPANFERYLQQEPETSVVVSETAKELCRKLAEESKAELTAAQKVKWAEDMQRLLDGGAPAERLRRCIVYAWFPGCWWNGKIAAPSDLARHHEKLYSQAMALEKEEEA